MEYLTLLKQKPGQPPDPKVLIALYRASEEWVKANLADRKLDCAYNVIPNANGYYGVGIGNFDSHEDAYQFLATHPFAPFTAFEVYSLSEVQRAIDDVVTAVQKRGCCIPMP